jgi:hypothetical protein
LLGDWGSTGKAMRNQLFEFAGLGVWTKWAGKWLVVAEF